MTSGTALARRVLRFVDRSPAPLRSALRRYTGPSLRRTAEGAQVDLPFWLVAPSWFVCRRSPSRHRRLLSDVSFGQYCLFLSVRIHDDLLDEQARDAWLVLAGDDLLIEAQAQFSRHVDTPAFRVLFRRLLRTTVHGIAECDRLQRRRSGMPASALSLYADVASVFNAGVAAVCLSNRCPEDYARFAAFARHLTIAGQILDDLEDVQEDAARGRLNVATTVMLGSRTRRLAGADSQPWRSALASAVLREGRAGRVCDLAGQYADRAERAARRMRVGPAIEYAASVADRCRALRVAAHRARAEELLGLSALRSPLSDGRTD